MVNATVIQVEKNIGGHGGFNLGVEYLANKYALKDNDLILGYDPDSNPITGGWLRAMQKVMDNDVRINNCSLAIKSIMGNRKWKLTDIAGVRYATSPVPEMMNVTIFRYGYLKRIGQFKGTGFYGGVETANWTSDDTQGYLYDYQEDFCPIPHDPRYNDWKKIHCTGEYKGNFDEYVKFLTDHYL
jgi:hypothetical protein